jgi:hypothetical protein
MQVVSGLEPTGSPSRRGNGHEGFDQVDTFAKQIRASWQKASASILETGRLLRQAQDKLSHGEWGLLFAVDDEDGERPTKLPFGVRTAQMLMKIAEHPVISNAKFISLLPPSWGTLARLTAIPEEALASMFTDGQITPETRVKDVDDIIKKMRDEGVYLWRDLRAALNVLSRFSKHYPNADELAYYVLEEERDEPVSMSKLAELMPWLAKLHAACEQEEADDNAASEARDREEVEETEEETETEPASQGQISRRRRTRRNNGFLHDQSVDS